MVKRSRCPAGKPRAAGSIPGGDIYLFACFPYSQQGETLAKEIKHDHSPVVNFVLDPRYDYSNESCVNFLAALHLREFRGRGRGTNRESEQNMREFNELT